MLEVNHEFRFSESWLARSEKSLIFCGLLLVADVAELADALDSKSSTRKSVWVRPPPSAPASFSGFAKKARFY